VWSTLVRTSAWGGQPDSPIGRTGKQASNATARRSTIRLSYLETVVSTSLVQLSDPDTPLVTGRITTESNMAGYQKSTSYRAVYQLLSSNVVTAPRSEIEDDA
jgi:hypothetical protein